SVRAIVLRMDSPGGSPLASDLIWREVMLARAQKPVIVSIAGMSASGGYYIASAATKIVASRTAIVGSIGVFGGKVVINQALENLGISTYTVPASPNEGAESRSQHLSPLTPWDDATRERVHETMSAIYTLFIERVAVGRGMDPSAVRKTAEGEIFLAQTGVERGLVDEIGGLSHAIELARKTAQLGPDTPVVLEGAQETLFETLFLGSEPEAQEVRAALERFETARLASVARFALGNGMLDQLRPYRAVLSPLLSGEAVVVALPFAVELR
ncbi:MAG TPA: S49 family peptidase, partial [Polyangiaceae bacterium]|nr:S49 family peptidase [Polyangiaceae bacterium]